MKTKCPKCGSQFGFFHSFVLSRTLPVKCSTCGEVCYRKHSLSYFSSLTFLSVGLFALIFVAMSSGFIVASYAAISLVVVTLLLYIAELRLFSIDIYPTEMARADKRRGIAKAALVILLIFGSVAIYFMQN